MQCSTPCYVVCSGAADGLEPTWLWVIRGLIDDGSFGIFGALFQLGILQYIYRGLGAPYYACQPVIYWNYICSLVCSEEKQYFVWRSVVCDVIAQWKYE